MKITTHIINRSILAIALGLGLHFTELAMADKPAFPAVEQTENDKPQQYSKVDLRTQSNKDGSIHFLTFIARSGGVAGHAYVSFAKHDVPNKMTSEYVYGLYPKDIKSDGSIPNDAKVLLGLVPQAIINEYCKSDSVFQITHRMRFIVDKNAYDKALELTKRESKKTDTYKLLLNDCVSFLQRVSKAANIDVPSRIKGLTPASYLEKVIKANK